MPNLSQSAFFLRLLHSSSSKGMFEVDEFNQNAVHMVWPEVRVLDKWENKKGTKCVKIGWLNDSGAGDQMFYGDDIYGRVNKGTTVTIRANKDGDFFRNYEVTDANEAPTTTRRRAASSS